jgi:hypothetical protein
MKMSRSLKKAYDLYSDFREKPARKVFKIDFDIPTSLMSMGNVKAIEYDTTRGGVCEKYRHDFAEGSRPILCADAVTGQLFIIKGRYHVTERGIVDLDGRGRELE